MGMAAADDTNGLRAAAWRQPLDPSGTSHSCRADELYRLRGDSIAKTRKRMTATAIPVKSLLRL
ncbi:hypothetical protein C1H46_019448 [Malus baccata]|uniref:Uncharacterized protein n=1 Tax=Malus baccata TaxID=106549 RepID=A0A540M858_MALBA|nr:hypothetical protein C1H46_019448 [Malus baccata]